nr:hypothetical protein [Streptomyces sp. NTH33]
MAGLGAGPAFAEEQQNDTLWIQAPYEQAVTVAPDGAAAGQDRDLLVGLYHDNDNFTVTDGRLTVDVSGLAGVAEVTWPENCAPSGSTAVCDVSEIPTTLYGGREQVRLKVHAVAGAAAGAQGTVTYEAEATGGPEGRLVAPHESFATYVTVGSGPDLGIARPERVKGVEPGSTLDVPFAVTNTGDRPAEGFALEMWTTYGLDLTTKFPQCTSTALDGPGTLIHFTCAFDTVVQPGATVGLPAPLKLAVARHALHERFDLSVRPGQGATDLDHMDNYAGLDIEADNTADFAVHGSTVNGKAGQTVTAGFRFENRGPAWVGNVRSGDPAAVLDFHVPEGTTVTDVPAGCQPRSLDGGYYRQRLGAPRYACDLAMYVMPKTKVPFSFQLRIDRVVPNATGTVVAVPGLWAGTQTFPFDPKPQNNSAEIVVNPGA